MSDYDDEREAEGNAELAAQRSPPGPEKAKRLPMQGVKRLRLTMVHPSGSTHPVGVAYFGPNGEINCVSTRPDRSFGPYYTIEREEIDQVVIRLEEAE